MSVRVNLQKAANICGVLPGTIRRWVHDGRIIRHSDDCVRPELCTGRDFYDVTELLHWIDARNPDALLTRKGIGGEHATRLRRGA